MLSQDSILRRVPAVLNPKQAFFIDGIRHAVEIMELAYHRLRAILTQIALNPPSSDDVPKLGPQVFLDAWAMIDAIDRFRMLYQQMPGMTRVSSEGVIPLSEVIEPFRQVRNISDHLAQRADHVLSYDGAALGSLTWCTGFEIIPGRLWFCTLRPGTIRTMPEFRREPLLTTIDWPTDRICLKAGGYEANLSAIRPHIELRIKHFEKQIMAQLEKHDLKNAPTANDVFLRQAYELGPGQFSWQE